MYSFCILVILRCKLYFSRNAFPLKLFDLSKKEVTKCGDVQKLLASVDV